MPKDIYDYLYLKANTRNLTYFHTNNKKSV